MKQDEMVLAYAPDKLKLAELVIEAKGPHRTMAQFAEDSGISAPTLSRIANGKINKPLSNDFLEKIYSSKCEDADFSFDTLLLANGMVKASVVDREKRYAENHTSFQERCISLERHAKNAIVNALMERGVTIQSIHPDYDNRKNEAPFGIRLSYDFNLDITGEKFRYWYFDAIYCSAPTGTGITFNHAARLFLLDAWCPEFLANQKTSYVFERRDAYEQFILRFKGAPIKTAVSAILIDST